MDGPLGRHVVIIFVHLRPRALGVWRRNPGFICFTTNTESNGTSRLNGCRLAYRMNLRLRRSGSEGFCPNANITLFDMTSLLEASILVIVQSGARMNCVTAW